MWKCSVCGYIHEGDDAPDNCPKCGAAKDKFAKLDEAAVELVDRSRYTNSLHMMLSSLALDIMDIAEEGVEDNLDPNCVKVFEYAHSVCNVIKNMVDAELAGHMSKGKWG